MADQSLLARLERQALEEGREWTRKRLAELIEKVAEQPGEVSPPAPDPGDDRDDPHARRDDSRR